MDKAQKKNPTDQAMLAVMADAQSQVPLPVTTEGSSIAEILRAAHARMEAEDKADEKSKAEVDALMERLIDNNLRKKELYRRQADERLERQAHMAAQAQVEADEREKLLDEDRDIYYQIRGKLHGNRPEPISLPGEQRPTITPKVKKRRWWK